MKNNPPPATSSQMRDMLERIRTLIGSINQNCNCPFCGVDFWEGEVADGKQHEDWCVYDALMEMVL